MRESVYEPLKVDCTSSSHRTQSDKSLKSKTLADSLLLRLDAMGDSDQAASLSPLRPPGHVSQDTTSLGDTLMQLPRMIRALGVVKDCHTASRSVARFLVLGTRRRQQAMHVMECIGMGRM